MATAADGHGSSAPVKVFTIQLGGVSVTEADYEAVLCAIPDDEATKGRRFWNQEDRVQGQEAALHFNISHDGGSVVAAVCAASEVGVDVMRCGRRNGGRRGAELVQELGGSFTVAERELLAWAAVAREGDDAYPSLCDIAFFTLWACKEAVLKALGVGLRVPLDRVATELDASQVECVHCSERARGRRLEVTPAAVPVAVPVRVCDAATPWQGCVSCWAEPGDYVVAVARRDGVLPLVERKEVRAEAALAAARGASGGK